MGQVAIDTIADQIKIEINSVNKGVKIVLDSVIEKPESKYKLEIQELRKDKEK